jgi:hypothetical protein
MKTDFRFVTLYGLVLAVAHCGGSSSSSQPFQPGSSGSGSGGSATSSGGSSNGGSGSSSGSGSSGGASGSSGGQSSGSSGGSSGAPSDDGGGTGAKGPDGGGGGLCFPAVTDFTTDGPFTAMSGDVASVSCTIFRPTMLGAGGCLNPVIVWGNGTTNSPSSYTALFNHLATQGFIVAAADTSNAGSGKEMLACLQYMIDQNTAAGSPYMGHVDVDHIASSGYSQGGAGCLEAGEDPRFKVIAAVSPYIVISLGGYDTTSVMKQVHPIFMLSGSADSVAVPSNNQQPIFDMAAVPIFWATHAGSTHFEVLGSGGAYAGPLTAFFRYELMGDPAARDWFEKPPCTLCSATGWTVQTNSMWK